MQLVKSGEKGQVLAGVTDDGAIVLRQADVYPIDIYSDERIASFLAEDRMTPEQTAMLYKALKKMTRCQCYFYSRLQSPMPVRRIVPLGGGRKMRRMTEGVMIGQGRIAVPIVLGFVSGVMVKVWAFFECFLKGRLRQAGLREFGQASMRPEQICSGK